MPIIASALFLSCILAGLVCFAAIPMLMPVLRRYALARPNARSSHVKPTPQGGGIAIVAAALIGVAFGVKLGVVPGPGGTLGILLIAAVGLAILGAVDDIRPLPAVLRFAVQGVLVGAVLWSVPAEARVLGDVLPAAITLALAILAALWFVNLTNFMDGLDWMTVANFAPILATLVLFAVLGELSPAAGLVAAALLGALLGFAPYNRPVARLFMGDVGSLPVGLLVGYAVYELAADAGLVPAAILVLYYGADATLTLLTRLSRREKVWEAHRSHFYQRATDNGWSVRSVVTTVFVLNLGLATLALVAANADGAVRWLALASAIAAVALVLIAFSRRRGHAG